MNKVRRKPVSLILKSYSNASLSTISGYTPELIHAFRKNEIDHFAVRTDKYGNGIPTRQVMEWHIQQKVFEYESERERKFNKVA